MIKYLAPRVGLEPTTLRLHETCLFLNSMDYLFTISGGGRLKVYSPSL